MDTGQRRIKWNQLGGRSEGLQFVFRFLFLIIRGPVYLPGNITLDLPTVSSSLEGETKKRGENSMGAI